ncbi:unnamed protein product [Larinioides sclopetarius]|uniref:Uncharacterized protein n=1 Tax=Larinioides sclopetarius TaxID=280406 RepID=A0AAV1ZIL5_9ARAC
MIVVYGCCVSQCFCLKTEIRDIEDVLQCETFRVCQASTNLGFDTAKSSYDVL